MTNLADAQARGPSAGGTVYGALLNDRRTVDRLAAQFADAPYKAAPRAPVLYIKPGNTRVADGACVVVPSGVSRVRVDATVGAVIGRRASRVSQAEALDFVEGYVIVSDLTVPHEVYYRPSIKHRCRDGFCPIGAMSRGDAFDPATAELVVSINGREAMREGFAGMVRLLPLLMQDVTEFMRLEPGDILLLGLQDTSPTAGAGDEVLIEVTGLGALRHRLVADSSDRERA